MNATVFRIEDSAVRGGLLLAFGAAGLLVLLWIVLTEQAIGAVRWIAAFLLAYLAFLLRHLFVQWRQKAPYLVASHAGIWLKEAESFGEIPWADVVSIDKVPLVRAFEIRLAGRRKYIGRISLLRPGLIVNLLLFSKITVPLHFTRLKADDVVGALRELRAGRA